MSKVEICREIISKADDLDSTIVIPAQEKQKQWRKSNFNVYNIGKSMEKPDVVIVDNYNNNIENIKKNVYSKAKLIITIFDLEENITEIEKTIDRLLESKIDHTNLVNINFEKVMLKIDNAFTFSFIKGSNKFHIQSKENEIIKELKKENSIISNDNFYYTWISSLKKIIENRDKKIESKKKDIKTLEQHIEFLQDRIDELEGCEKEKKKLIKTRDKLRNKLQELEKRKEIEVRKAKEDKNEKIESLHDRLDDKQSTISKLKDQISNLKQDKEQNINKEIKKREKMISDFNEKIDELNKELDKKNNKIESLIIENSELRNDIKDIRNALKFNADDDYNDI